jgi:VWFA-related protein
MHKPRCIAPWLSALLIAPAAAQPPLPGFVDVVDVSLVNVEVKAFTRGGEPVTDLRAEDFRLYENGVQVPITNFFSSASVSSRDDAPQSPARDPIAQPERAPVVADAPLHVAILVDNAHLRHSQRTLALRGIADFVDDLPAGARVMLASYDGALNVRVGFEASRDRLLVALAGEAWTSTSGTLAEHEARGALELIRWRAKLAIEVGRPLDIPCTRELLDLARTHAAPKHAQVRHAIASLGLLVDAVGALPGHKLLLLVSDGLPLRPGAEAFAYVGLLCDGSGARQGIEWAIDATDLDQVRAGEAEMASLAYSVADDLAAVTGRANAAGVTLYTLQASGLKLLGAADAAEGQRRFTPEFEAERRANEQDALVALAVDTGGRALLERNDYTAALAGISEDLAHHYSLGFTPTGRSSGRASTVRVEVDRPGVHLRYRRRSHQRTPEEDAVALLRAALILDVVTNPLALTLAAAGSAAGAAPAAPGGWRVRLAIPAAGLSCFGEGASRRCLITVFLGAQREDGSLTEVRSKSLPLALPAASDTQQPEHYVYEVEMPAAAAPHRIAAVVRDEMSGELSTALVTIPTPGTTRRSSR